VLNAAAAAARTAARGVWGIVVPAILPISGYGAYSVLQTTAGVVAQIGLLGTSQTILREPGRKVPIGGLLLHSLLLAGVALPVAVLIAPLPDPRYPWLLGALVLGLLWYGIAVTRAKAVGAFADVLRAELVGAAAFVVAIGAVVCLVLGRRRPVDYGGVVLLEVVATAALLAALGRLPGGRIAGDEWRLAGTPAFLRSVYSVGGLVLLDLLIWRRLEIYFLQASPDGLRGVAVFGLASQLSSLLLLVPSAFAEAWSPAFAADFRIGWVPFERRFRENRRVYRRIIALLVLAAAAITPLLIRVVFPKYWPWVWQASAFVLIRVVASYAGLHSAAIYATKRERWLYAPVIAGGVVGVVSNVVLTLPWGLRGAILAYALTQGTVAVATLVVSRASARATAARGALP
jgi:O-antigen/teichoic acid export membrane protein